MLVRSVLTVLALALLAGCSSTVEPVATHRQASTPTPSQISTPTPAPTHSPTATPTPTPTPTPPRAPTDACHQGGQTYCELNPDVTQATIGQTICVSGWTATVRPSSSYTTPLKRAQMAAEGLPGTTRDYEEDHRMPLELGGSPASTSNLSPEQNPSPNPKDSDENRLKDEVCDGQLTLAQAQATLVAKWLAPWPGYKE